MSRANIPQVRNSMLSYVPLAQKVEHLTCRCSVKVTSRCRSVWSGEAGAVPAIGTINQVVRGSNPRWHTITCRQSLRGISVLLIRAR